jgi:hypothetical protein
MNSVKRGVAEANHESDREGTSTACIVQQRHLYHDVIGIVEDLLVRRGSRVRCL